MSKPLIKDLTYYQTGGTAEEIFTPSSTEEVAQILEEIFVRKSPYYFLGGGSNSLAMDDPYKGSVISFHKLKSLEFSDDEMIVGAGVDNTDLAKAAYQAKKDGLSWMYRLPGQVGATVRMNARCYGGEISQVVKSVEVVTPQGQIKTYQNQGIFKGYKDTIFMESGEAITRVTFQVKKGDQERILSEMEYCEQDRIKKHQFDYPSCGCVFKNNYDIGVPSGLLLQESGAKAMSVSGAVVNPHHANFVFNQGASSRSILELTLDMRDAVFEKFGVFLDYEMEVLGAIPEELKSRFMLKKSHQPIEEKLTPLREAFKQKGKPKSISDC